MEVSGATRVEFFRKGTTRSSLAYPSPPVCPTLFPSQLEINVLPHSPCKSLTSPSTGDVSHLQAAVRATTL